MNTNISKMTAKQLYNEHMKSEPKVLRLKLSLDIRDINDEEMDILKKYGNVENGIIREILVPSDITLHALSFAIMRCFGWQNSHLHWFRFPTSVFQKLTKGKNKPNKYGYVVFDGVYKNWIDLCGLYFRFPSDNFEDTCWDDDYEEGQNVKKWFAEKYTGPYVYGGNGEHYQSAHTLAQDFVKKKPLISEHMSFDDWMRRSTKDGSKDVPINNVYRKIEETTIQDMQFFLNGSMDDILERIPLIELLLPKGMKIDKNILDEVALLAEQQKNVEYELPVIPLADELVFAYDSGDGWEVNITMTDCYYMDKDDSKVKGASRIKVFDMDNQLVDEELASLIIKVNKKYKPICIKMDGLSVMDDVGGVGGYIDFLRKIYEEDSVDDYEGDFIEDAMDDYREKEELKDWAKWMGWSSSPKKAETLL